MIVLNIVVFHQSISTYYYRLKLFWEWCEDNEIEKVSELTGWKLDEFERHRRAEGATVVTLNNEFTTLRSWLEYCAGLGLVDEEVADTVEPPTVPTQEQSDDTLLEAEDAIELLTYYREGPDRASRAHVLLEIAWFTGARIGGLRALDVRDFYPDNNYVDFVNRTDTGTPLKKGLRGERPVAIPAEVCDVIAEYIDGPRIDIYDEQDRQPLIASQRGRPAPGTLRGWMYQATIPCRHSPCPHEREQSTCRYTAYNYASGCPSSRSPHQVRTGAITWMLTRGMPAPVVAERMNASVETITEHYDKEDPVREMDERRRPHLDQLTLEDDS